jgi:hypothetical protein
MDVYRLITWTCIIQSVYGLVKGYRCQYPSRDGLPRGGGHTVASAPTADIETGADHWRGQER